MKIIVSHPSGNAFVRGALGGFREAAILHSFHTSIACFPGSLLEKLSVGPLAEIRRRNFASEVQPVTHTWPFKEAGRLLSARLGLRNLIKHEQGAFCVDAVYRYIDGKVAAQLSKAKKGGATGIYAYEDEALLTFREAKRLGLDCYYDLPIGYWRAARRMMQEEAAERPEWAATLTGLKDSPQKLANKDEELQLSKLIVVASSFTAKTLEEFPGQLAPVKVVPYAFPEVGERRTYDRVSGRPLKLLFVGGLSQRKGIANLFEAVEQLGSHVQLTIVGNKTTEDCPALNAALARHTWIPSLPHQQVLSLMRQHDVLVFPSLFEGFGLVITEAMAQGTPVITTDRTAGADIITHNENGWLTEAGSTPHLKAAIEHLLSNPESIARNGAAAQEKARTRNWETYGTELANAIVSIK